MGNEHGEQEIEKWEQSRELEIKLLMGLEFELGFVSISHFPIPHFRACLHGGGGPQVGEVTCGRSPHLSCKCDQIKKRNYMDRRGTPTSKIINRPLFSNILFHQIVNMIRVKTCTYGAVCKSYQSY